MGIIFLLLWCTLGLIIFIVTILGYVLLYDYVRRKIKGYGTEKQAKMEN